MEWNGVPIAEAIRRRGEVERGGRPDSAMARALDSLTLRPLGLGPAPDEKWVIVGYRTGEDQPLREHRFEWRFIDPGPGPDEPHPTAPAATATAMHPDRALVRRAKKLSFNTGLWTTEDYDRMFALGASRDASGWLTGKFQDNVSARSITVDGRDYGYLRLWSFDLSDDDGFVAEVISMLGQLPQDGLIIDLRGNPGGLIWAAERLLQLFTPSRISPSRFSIIASDLTRAMTDAPQNRRELGPWRRTLLEAIGTGEVYSQSVTITPFERCNDIGQVYGGPVVAVVDPTTYSAADLFAAGFADNGLGTVVSVGRATGAGGANVWRVDTLNSVLAGTAHQPAQAPQRRRLHDVGPPRHAYRRVGWRTDRRRRHRRSPFVRDDPGRSARRQLGPAHVLCPAARGGAEHIDDRRRGNRQSSRLPSASSIASTSTSMRGPTVRSTSTIAASSSWQACGRRSASRDTRAPTSDRYG